VPEERKEEIRKKRYRDPIPGSEEEERVEQFRRAGIELLIEDVEPGEHRLMFFGAGRLGTGHRPG
jgi:hypothetical protein